MTSPTTVEQPAKVPPDSEVEQLTTLLVSAASAAAVVGFLAGLAGVGFEAANKLTAMSEIDGLLQLKPPLASAPQPVMIQHLANLRRRAAYLIMASRRIGTAVVRERNQPGSVSRAIERERAYFSQHLSAVQRRNQAALVVASRAEQFGSTLGWYAVRDDRTSPECRAAHGSDFSATKPPRIGYPGTVHPRCRCKPGRPFGSGRTVDAATQPLRDPVLLTEMGLVVEAIEMTKHEVDSRSLPEPPNKPGKTNWVEQTGHLPPYIKRIVKHLMFQQGMAEGHAIATAKNTVERWATGGTVTAHGGPQVSAKTRAQAAAALAQWKAQAAAARAS